MSNFPWTPPPPTDIPEGYTIQWDGTEWLFVEMPKPAPPPDPIPPETTSETQ